MNLGSQGCDPRVNPSCDDSRELPDDGRLRLLSFNIQVGISTERYRHYLTRGWQHLLPTRAGDQPEADRRTARRLRPRRPPGSRRRQPAFRLRQSGRALGPVGGVPLLVPAAQPQPRAYRPAQQRPAQPLAADPAGRSSVARSAGTRCDLRALWRRRRRAGGSDDASRSRRSHPHPPARLYPRADRRLPPPGADGRHEHPRRRSSGKLAPARPRPDGAAGRGRRFPAGGRSAISITSCSVPISLSSGSTCSTSRSPTICRYRWRFACRTTCATRPWSCGDAGVRHESRRRPALERQVPGEHRAAGAPATALGCRIDLLRRGLVRNVWRPKAATRRSTSAEGAARDPPSRRHGRRPVGPDSAPGKGRARLEQRRQQRTQQNIDALGELAQQLLALDLPRELRKPLKQFARDIEERARQSREIPILLSELSRLQRGAGRAQGRRCRRRSPEPVAAPVRRQGVGNHRGAERIGAVRCGGKQYTDPTGGGAACPCRSPSTTRRQAVRRSRCPPARSPPSKARQRVGSGSPSVASRTRSCWMSPGKSGSTACRYRPA